MKKRTAAPRQKTPAGALAPHSRSSAKNGEQVTMTLRIEPSDRKKLHGFTMKLAEKVGKRVSYNTAMLELIRQFA